MLKFHEFHYGNSFFQAYWLFEETFSLDYLRKKARKNETKFFKTEKETNSNTKASWFGFFIILTFHASAPLDEKRMMLFNMHN